MATVLRSYPSRSPEFLCEVIAAEWGMQVSEQELREPRAETVQAIYSAILADVLSIDVRTFERDAQDYIESETHTVEHPEFHYDAMKLQMLHYHMGRVAKVAKVQKFLVRDLTRPTGAQTIRILSAICNFRAFSDVDERQEFLLGLQRVADEKQARLDDRLAELQDVEDELTSKQLALEADKPELARVHEHIEKLKIEIREHHRYVEEQSARASELRSLKKELKGKLEALTSEIQDLHRSNAADKGRILQSPERVRRKIQDMTSSTEQLKPEIANVESVKAMYAAKETILRTLIQNAKDAVRDLEGLRDELQALDQRKEEHARLLATQGHQQAQHNLLLTRLSQADRQRQRAEEKLSDIRTQHLQKQESARKKHEILQERYRELLALRGDRDEDDSKMRERMEAILKQQEDFIDEQQAEINGLYNEFLTMRDVVRSYIQEFDSSLGLAVYKQEGKRGPSSKGASTGKSTNKKKRKTVNKGLSVEPSAGGGADGGDDGRLSL